jgi:hypothetical protein
LYPNVMASPSRIPNYGRAQELPYWVHHIVKKGGMSAVNDIGAYIGGVER